MFYLLHVLNALAIVNLFFKLNIFSITLFNKPVFVFAGIKRDPVKVYFNQTTKQYIFSSFSTNQNAGQYNYESSYVC